MAPLSRPRQPHLDGGSEDGVRPGRHRVDPIGEQDRFVHVVRDQDHGRPALAPDPQELVLQCGAGERVERAERLVHQQELRPHGEAAGYCHALPHAARELARALPGGRREVDEGDELVGDLPSLGGRQAGVHGVDGERDIVADAEPRQQRVVLEDDAALGAGPRHGNTIEPDLSGVRRDETAQERDERGLPRPGVADDRDELALVEGQIDPTEHGRPTAPSDVGLPQASHLDVRHQPTRTRASTRPISRSSRKPIAPIVRTLRMMCE
jgi:hypothetical protein